VVVPVAGVAGGDSSVGESESINFTWWCLSSGDADCVLEKDSEVGAGCCGDCDFVADMDDCESRVGTLDVPGVSVGVAPNEASLLLSSFEGN
jgi:hypothetical protein